MERIFNTEEYDQITKRHHHASATAEKQSKAMYSCHCLLILKGISMNKMIQSKKITLLINMMDLSKRSSAIILFEN